MKIRIGIIGSGRIGMRHAKAYEKIPNTEIVGFSDKFSKRAKELAKLFKTEYFSVEQLVNEKSIDAIHICTPNDSHAKFAILSMKKGKHVLVEKPMALSLKDCKKMIDTSKKMKVNLMIGHTFRFYPYSLKVKKILDSGKIGTPKLILDYGIFSPGIIPKKEKPSWDRKRRFDSGIFIDAIHQVDKLRYWLNSDVSTVYVSQMGKIEKSSPFEQLGNIVLNFKNGTSATIITAANPWEISDIQSKIIGTNGILYAKYGEEIKVGKSKWKNISFDYKSSPPSYRHNLQGFVNEITEFTNSIKKSRTPISNGAEGMKNLSVVLAMYESIKKKRIIKLKN